MLIFTATSGQSFRISGENEQAAYDDVAILREGKPFGRKGMKRLNEEYGVTVEFYSPEEEAEEEERNERIYEAENFGHHHHDDEDLDPCCDADDDDYDPGYEADAFDYEESYAARRMEAYDMWKREY
jgi:hypothetical protein